MPAEQDKSGDIPAHDKNARGKTYDRGTCGTHITQVFRREKEGRGTIGAHKTSIQCAEQDQPEDQQNLEFFDVQQQ
jgi:hypothetical protein